MSLKEDNLSNFNLYKSKTIKYEIVNANTRVWQKGTFVPGSLFMLQKCSVLQSSKW